MSQSSFSPDALRDAPGLHVAIVMDGNGRWAERRGIPRSAGHRVGASAVRRTVSAAAAQGIGTLTLYAFSSDNWRRPTTEVEHLLRLFESHLTSEAERCEREEVRVSVIGRRDRLEPALVAAIESVEARTGGGTRLHLQLAIDYSGRDAILEAANLHGAAVAHRRAEPISRAGASCAVPALSREAFAQLIGKALHARTPVPEVDLLIRTGGEQRLSDFMLWECAYAELVFTRCLWPDFGESELERALEEFRLRERRFGGVVVDTAAGTSRHGSTALRPSPGRARLTPFRSTRDGEARSHG